jgi:hypothetical protein
MLRHVCGLVLAPVIVAPTFHKSRSAKMSLHGTSQPWQLPRRTAGHGSKADTQPLAEREQRIAELEQEIERRSAPRRPLSSPPVRRATADARRGSCWVSRL